MKEEKIEFRQDHSDEQDEENVSYLSNKVEAFILLSCLAFVFLVVYFVFM